MLIAMRNPRPIFERTITILGKPLKFTRRKLEEDLTCDVTDDDAVAVLTHTRNANVYYAVKGLTRAPATKPEAEAILAAITTMLERRGKTEGDGDFTADGIPNCNVLSRMCGFTVKKDAMIEVWNSLAPADANDPPPSDEE